MNVKSVTERAEFLAEPVGTVSASVCALSVAAEGRLRALHAPVAMLAV